MDWIVAGVLVFVGLIAAVGIYLGRRDPVTRDDVPGAAGLFVLGRIRFRPMSDEGRQDKDERGDGPGAGKP